ncbi:hypothetical protein Y032_0145g2492 [Ancylostoma ceylanicum]|uniref:Uncharacterized protein n=1 Tax=Ancylostoma ceylanicum TaxID=53326 RepID=A0A016T2M7_9BILA|nr:hypothetical protein Y032_0145g2492 [Ancylostoma ceylanicum]
MASSVRKDEVESHMKFAFFFLHSAQHRFTVLAYMSHGLTRKAYVHVACPYQEMFAFDSMSEGLIVIAHVLR